MTAIGSALPLLLLLFDQTANAVQISGVDVTRIEQVADQRRDVTLKQQVGQAGNHRAANFLLRYEGAIEIVSARLAAGDHSGLLEPGQNRRDGGEGETAFGIGRLM